MNITLVNIAYYPNIEGGAEVSTQKLAEGLAERGHKVSVICHGESRSIEEHNGVSIYRMKVRTEFKNKIIRNLTRSFRVQLYREIRDLLKKTNPDIVHTNNLHAFSVIVWKAAKDLGIPIVHTLRDYTLMNAWYAYERKINRYFSNRVDCVTAPSAFTLNAFAEKNYFRKAEKKVIPNAIDFDSRKTAELAERKMGLPESAVMGLPESAVIRFAFLGRFSSEKGVDLLISTFNNMETNAELHLFGKGKLNERSEEIIRQNKRIIDQGFLSEDELGNRLSQMDVVAAPSLWDEPFGRVIIDAYKYACPVIVTKRGGMPEIVEDGISGIIMKEETSAELEAAIRHYLDRNRIRNDIPRVIKKLEEFSLEKQVDTFLEVYSALAD